ncbi:unnamed protein product [Paramecium octaurelia]|uniref:Uncharacterized protein n=1 Tax=Paramecium octaurelia TaxID=43137 RepID=A0A8S1YNV7_PAROT|nr:unnamed protein product [Paramecium octaurelia]
MLEIVSTYYRQEYHERSNLKQLCCIIFIEEKILFHFLRRAEKIKKCQGNSNEMISQKIKLYLMQTCLSSNFFLNFRGCNYGQVKIFCQHIIINQEQKQFDKEICYIRFKIIIVMFSQNLFEDKYRFENLPDVFQLKKNNQLIDVNTYITILFIQPQSISEQLYTQYLKHFHEIDIMISYTLHTQQEQLKVKPHLQPKMDQKHVTQLIIVLTYYYIY